MNKQISIIGCGWLGLPLAKQLHELGYTIKGSTTSSSKVDILKSNGVSPYVITLDNGTITGDISGFLSGSGTMIINIPPGLRRNPEKNHVSEIQSLTRYIKHEGLTNVLFISSTSVYEDVFPFAIINDDIPPNGTSINAKQLIEIEQFLKQTSPFKTTIIRMSGLFDDQRHPARFLSGKTELKNGEAPVNLIHKLDAITAITTVITNDIWGSTFNLAYPYHPNKQSYYTNVCNALGIPTPLYNTKQQSVGKLIDTSKLVQLLGYSFKEQL